jgi:hypothetical protein
MHRPNSLTSADPGGSAEGSGRCPAARSEIVGWGVRTRCRSLHPADTRHARPPASARSRLPGHTARPSRSRETHARAREPGLRSALAIAAGQPWPGQASGQATRTGSTPQAATPLVLYFKYRENHTGTTTHHTAPPPLLPHRRSEAVQRAQARLAATVARTRSALCAAAQGSISVVHAAPEEAICAPRAVAAARSHADERARSSSLCR